MFPAAGNVTIKYINEKGISEITTTQVFPFPSYQPKQQVDTLL